MKFLNRTNPEISSSNDTSRLDTPISESEEIAKAVREALETVSIYDETSLQGILDTLGNKTIEEGIEFALEHLRDESQSPESYFTLNRMTEEGNEAFKSGKPEALKECIGSEAGIWGYQTPIKEMRLNHIYDLIRHNSGKASRDNLAALKRIYNHNRESSNLNFSFEERDEPGNLERWISTLGKHRDSLTLEGFKEWGARYYPPRVSKSYGIKFEATLEKRDPVSNPEFQIEVIRKEDLEERRDFAKMADTSPVCKVILVQNERGLIDQIETWFPHFTSNEDQGRRVLNTLLEGITVDDRVEYTTEILRKITLYKDMAPNFLYDIKSDIPFTREEDSLLSDALGSFAPRMNATTLISEIWLALHGRDLAYTCVAPINSADLNFALVPKPTDLTDLISLIKNYDVEKLLGINSSEMGSIRTQRIYDLPPVSRAIKSLIEINRFAKDEISRAKKKGRSTLNVLGAGLPDTLRFIFKSIFRDKNRLISEGSFQISSVEFGKQDSRNSRFATALNLFTEDAMSVQYISSTGDRRLCLRTRTNEDVIKIAKKLIGRNGISHLDDAVKEVVKQDGRRFRIHLAISSLIIRERKLREVYSDKLQQARVDKAEIERTEQEYSELFNSLYEKADKAFDSIINGAERV